jgi:probable HAF family extracellular repeat protein
MEGRDLSLHKTDLGTLGGPNSAANRPNGKEIVPVISETSTPDPLGEDFCNFGNHLICLGALWNGVLTPLPTLGGNNGMTTLSNNRDQIAGLAENSTHDSTCSFPSQVLRFEAVVWGPKRGEIHELPPLPGDTVGYALGINERGQVVGSSGSCANTGPTPVGLFIGQHAVLWENGRVKDLGSLGGKMMGKAGAINDRGEVAGFSDLPSGEVVSFLWTKNRGMQSLGALGADVLGYPRESTTKPRWLVDHVTAVGTAAPSSGKRT